MISDWEQVWVLPNLSLPVPDEHSPTAYRGGDWSGGLGLEGTDIALIVPHGDSRLNTIIEAKDSVGRLLECFRDTMGAPYRPAVLIARKAGDGEAELNGEGVLAFRNAVALPFILKARAAQAESGMAVDAMWSDAFDFHPARVADTGSIVSQGEGLVALYSTKRPITFTPSPHVSLCGRRLYADWYLRRALSQLWREAYLHGKAEAFHRTVFRALELSYIAASVGARNQGSVTDYGIQLALWVSALEVLAWPEEEFANQLSVLALLGQYTWASDNLNGPFTCMKIGKKLIIENNPIQHVCAFMYQARNDIMHGEPISWETLIPQALTKGTSLSQLSPIVFRTALTAFLERRIPALTLSDSDDDNDLGFELFDEMNYSGPLKEAIGLKKREWTEEREM